MAKFNDHFSTVANQYAQFRPSYPDHLFKLITDQCKQLTIALDIGTGSGQAAIKLSRYCQQVWALDPSWSQISQTTANQAITYWVATAEATAVKDQSVDLITVAQAAHWFQFDAFYQECSRILKPQGTIALWTYGPPQISSANTRIAAAKTCDDLLQHFYYHTLGSYWPAERAYVDSLYRDLPFPYTEIALSESELTGLQIVYQWPVEALLGYLSTWSACRQYEKQHGKSPLIEFATALYAEWPKQTEFTITWPLALKMGTTQ